MNKAKLLVMINKHIGNFGNNPRVTESKEELAEVLLESNNVMNILDNIYTYIGNPHKRKDFDTVFHRLAEEIRSTFVTESENREKLCKVMEEVKE